MEKEQIVKALECCTRKPRANCKECPYALAEDRCMVSKLQRDSLSLIREQEKRIEELETSCTELTQNLHACKADTVRKMQGRLKAEAITVQDHTGKLDSVVLANTIDQTAQQLLEENT